MSRRAKAADYHHGDLRRALMAEALVMMRRHGTDGVSLRELARRLNVTCGAPHHHFAGKDDLFAAIAEAAFADLVAEIQQRVAVRDPTEQLRIIARTYLAFAFRDPARYRVMFLPQLRDRKSFTALHATGGRALVMLAAAFASAGVPAAGARARAVGCWSTLHGFAMLANDEFLDDATTGTRDALVEAIVAAAITIKMPAR